MTTVDDTLLLESMFYAYLSEMEELLGSTLSEEQVDRLQSMYMRGALDAITSLMFGQTGFDTSIMALHQEAEEYFIGDLDEEAQLEEDQLEEGGEGLPPVPDREGPIH